MSDRGQSTPDNAINSERMQILLHSRDQLSEFLRLRTPDCLDYAMELIKARSYTDLAIHHQQHYADALSYLSSNAIRIASQFNLEFSESFSALFVASSQSHHSSESLSLVQDSALERQIRLDTVTARVVSENRGELHQLLERINFLSKKALSTHENPLGPRFVTSCFEKLVSSNISQIRVQMLVLKAFEEKILVDLKSIYPEINRALAKKGVLPDLDRRVQKKASTSSPRIRKEGNDNAYRYKADVAQIAGNDSRSFNDDETSHQRFRELYQRIRRRNGAGEDRPNSQVSGVNEAFGMYDTQSNNKFCDQDALLSLLSRLPRTSEDNETEQTVDGSRASAKRRIAPKLEHLAAENQFQPISAEDMEIAHLVDELFEQAREWDGSGVCDGLFEKVDQLRAPIAKIALCDSGFLEKPHHPIRRFFAELSGLAWISQTQDETFHKRISTKLESVISGMEEIDPQDKTAQSGYFGKMLVALDIENRQVQKRENLLKRRETGGSEIHQATKYISRYLESKKSSTALSEQADEFLTRIWSSMLLRAFLIRDKQQELWIIVTELTQQFFEIYEEPESERRGRKGADQVLVSFHKTLSEHGLNNHVSDKLLGQIAIELGFEGLFYSALATDSELLAVANSDEFRGPIDTQSRVNGDADSGRENVENLSQPEVHHSWQAELPIGSWVVLSEQNGKSLTCRLLTVISPGEKCLFVDGLGKRVASMHSSEVRTALDNGILRKQSYRNAFEIAEQE